MSTAQEIEEAIRALGRAERDKLLQQLPQLFPELAGDAEWERIIRGDQARPAFSALLDGYEADLSANADSYPKVAEGDFDQEQEWSRAWHRSFGNSTKDYRRKAEPLLVEPTSSSVKMPRIRVCELNDCVLIHERGGFASPETFVRSPFAMLTSGCGFGLARTRISTGGFPAE